MAIDWHRYPRSATTLIHAQGTPFTSFLSVEAGEYRDLPVDDWARGQRLDESRAMPADYPEPDAELGPRSWLHLHLDREQAPHLQEGAGHGNESVARQRRSRHGD